MTIEAHWRELVTTALLGTDRREPPESPGPLGDFVADTVRTDPSARMLAHVAACTAVRRAGVQPGPPMAPLVPVPYDERTPCSAAAVERWHHITTSWPVLEDEWMVVLIVNEWKVALELVPAMLRRHRRDPLRRERVLVASGPSAHWLVEHLPHLDPTTGSRSRPVPVDPNRVTELSDLPIPPDLSRLRHLSGAEIGGTIAVGLEDRALAESHRAVLVNLIARCNAEALVDVADILDAVDPISPGRGLASVLADLATTRHRMLDELGKVAQ